MSSSAVIRVHELLYTILGFKLKTRPCVLVTRPRAFMNFTFMPVGVYRAPRATEAAQEHCGILVASFLFLVPSIFDAILALWPSVPELARSKSDPNLFSEVKHSYLQFNFINRNVSMCYVVRAAVLTQWRNVMLYKREISRFDITVALLSQWRHEQLEHNLVYRSEISSF